MASDQHILVKIQETATTFSEVLKLASKIFIRVPKSQPQYKWVEATYGLTSPSFDKKLYLTKKDLEYYSYKRIWILSPNDKWGIVREFTRREQYIVSESGYIMDKSNDPWLKVAIGTGANIVVFDNVIKHLITMALALDQLSSSYALAYRQFNDKIHYEFQGTDAMRNNVQKLLNYLGTAKTAAGPLSPSITEMFLDATVNDTSLYLQEEDVIEIKDGIVVDEAFVLSPRDEYSTIYTISADEAASQAKLDKFANSTRGNFVVMSPDYGPWILVHPKLIHMIKTMITQYGQLVKQNIQINGAPIANKCEELITGARNEIRGIKTEGDINYNIDAYYQAVRLLQIRTSIVESCNIAVPDDPFQSSSFSPYYSCQFTLQDKENFKEGAYQEIYIIPTYNGNTSIPVIVDTKEKMELDGLKYSFVENDDPSKMYAVSPGSITPWLILKRDPACSSRMYYILAQSISKMVNMVPEYKRVQFPV